MAHHSHCWQQQQKFRQKGNFPKNMSRCTGGIFLVGLERKLIISCLFFFPTDECDSDGGNYSPSHLYYAVACNKVYKW